MKRGPAFKRRFPLHHRNLSPFPTKVYGSAAVGDVIANTCELAQYLKASIEASSELQLMAPVSLNVVCFRYRFDQAAAVFSDLCPKQVSDQLNQELVVRI